MISAFKNSVTMWLQYWNHGFYQYLLLLAVLYLFLFKRKKAAAKQLLTYLVFVLFIFFFPVTAKIISACIGSNVYWRVLWLLPLFPVIAYAGAEFISALTSKKLQYLVLILCVVVIGISGKDMFSSGDYYRLANNQKVPNEVATACNLIREKAEEDGIEEIYLASDDWVAAYVRVYDPSILMPYGRNEKGGIKLIQRRLSRNINNPNQHRYKKLGKRAAKVGCNFLILPATEKDPTSGMEKAHWTEIGTAGSYRIFQYIGKKKS